MSEKRHYLRVQRVKPSQLFLLTRVDPVDGRRFHVQEIVAACQQCRCVSRRQHWMAAGGVCPICGEESSIPFNSLRDLNSRGKLPVVHAQRKIPIEILGAIGLMALLFVLITAVLMHQTQQYTDPTGFQKTEDGRFFYQDSAGRRYMDGSYEIDGTTYLFSDGFLDGAYAVPVHSTTYLTDDNGRLHTGWSVLDGKYVYSDKEGMIASRRPTAQSTAASTQVQSNGFYALEGLGTVYVTADGRAPSGWIVHDGGLYHLYEGAPRPIQDMPGSFTAQGRYLPDAAGFVDVQEQHVFLYEDGSTGSGLMAHQGYVYALNDQGCRLLSWTGQRDVSCSPVTGALVPQRDMLLTCADGMVIVEGRTGLIRTGWLLFEKQIYCTDAQGYLLTSCTSAEADGRFDASGRFLPDAQGPFTQGGLRCYLQQDGSLATGYLTHNGMLYAYGEDGQLTVNAPVKNIGMIGSDGAFRPYVAGMYQLGDGHYCFDASGRLMTGWQRSGKLYYFDPVTGRRASVGTTVDGTAYALGSDGSFSPLQEGVYQLGGNAYYVNTRGEVLTGWRAVDGVLTYFDEQTGAQRSVQSMDSTVSGWLQRENTRFYVMADGSVARGWQIIDEEAYYFDPATGAIATGRQEIDGISYTFRQDGLLQPAAPMRVIVDGEPVRIGVKGRLEGGMLYDGGHLYCFDAKTARLAHHLPEGMEGYISVLGGYVIPMQEGLYRVGSAAYYLDLSGNVLTGWFQKGTALYLADPATGMLHADGYDPDWKGSFRDGRFTPEQDGAFTADGRMYYFHDGRMTTGWIPLDNGVGYIDPVSGKLLDNAQVLIDDTFCSFQNGLYKPAYPTVVSLPSGPVLLGSDGVVPQQSGVMFMGDHLMAHTARGTLARSAAEAGLDPATFTVKDGRVLPLIAGIRNVYGTTYMLQADGKCTTGVVFHNGHLYYFYPATGQMCVDALGHDSLGIYQPKHIGVFHYQGNTYWALDETGRIATGMFEDQAGAVRYADEQGRLAQGVTTVAGKRYCFGDAAQSYQMICGTFIHLSQFEPGNNSIIYAAPDGELVTGWHEINGTLHCFDENGVMLYDTIKDGRYINIYGEVL